MPTPRFDEKKQRWIIDACVDGRRKKFTSSLPGKKGLKEVNNKYQLWLLGEATGEKTVNAVASDYLEEMKARLGDNSESYIQNEGYIRLYIAPKIGRLKMCKITQKEWQSVLNEATGKNKPLSKKTLQNLRGIISALIKYGYQNYQCELLRGNLYIPAGHSAKEKEILQPSEVKKLFEPSSKWYHPLFCFLVLTGMRPGEALGLKVEDIQAESIRIRRSVNARGKITEGKNENARREVPIGPTARKILDDVVKRNEDNKLYTEWVFCSDNGGPGNQSTMRNQWNELKEERGLHGTIYGLRHTFISIMKNVLPEQQIKDIVGHSVSMDTFGTYGHIVDGESQKSAEIIDLTFNQIAK